MMESFLQYLIEEMNMSDRHGNTIFDTSIWDDNDCVRFIRCIKDYFIKFMAMSSFTFVRVIICFIKIITTRERIAKSRTQTKLLIKRIKQKKNTIKTIIGVSNRTFDVHSLFGSHVFQQQSMMIWERSISFLE